MICILSRLLLLRKLDFKVRGHFHRFVRCHGDRSGRLEEAVHFAAQLREGLGPGLPKAVHKRNALLDRGPLAQGPAASGRGASHNAHRWRQGHRISGNVPAMLIYIFIPIPLLSSYRMFRMKSMQGTHNLQE